MLGPKDDDNFQEELTEEFEEAEEESREKYREDDFDEAHLTSNAPNITNTPGEDDDDEAEKSNRR